MCSGAVLRRAEREKVYVLKIFEKAVNERKSEGFPEF